MEALGLDGLEAAAGELDARVMESADLDRFCSSSDWIIPAARALMPPRRPFIRRTDAGFIALAEAGWPGGRMLQPLEAMWGLGCPIVGADVDALAASLAEALRRDAPDAAFMLCGLVEGSARFRALVRALGRRYRLGIGVETVRYVASLEGGLEGFLARRGPKLRYNLRRAARRAAERGVRFEACPVGEADADAAYARLLAVEARSWKGREGVGLGAGEMREFYRLMIRRLAKRGAVRLLFARAGDEDLAFVFGGVRGTTYRGLQFSFVEGWEDCALGNLGHVEQIRRLCDEGISAYDLGAEVEYKRRWGELAHATLTLIGFP